MSVGNRQRVGPRLIGGAKPALNCVRRRWGEPGRAGDGRLARARRARRAADARGCGGPGRAAALSKMAELLRAQADARAAGQHAARVASVIAVRGLGAGAVSGGAGACVGGGL